MLKDKGSQTKFERKNAKLKKKKFPSEKAFLPSPAQTPDCLNI
jgi:hypothetical protein